MGPDMASGPVDFHSMSNSYSKKRLSKRQRASLYSSPEFTARADADSRLAISDDGAARWRVRGTPWATCAVFCGRPDVRIGARRFASIGMRRSLGHADLRPRALASSPRLWPGLARIERRGLALRSRSRVSD
jgi:hypothetical protein